MAPPTSSYVAIASKIGIYLQAEKVEVVVPGFMAPTKGKRQLLAHVCCCCFSQLVCLLIINALRIATREQSVRPYEFCIASSNPGIPYPDEGSLQSVNSSGSTGSSISRSEYID